MRLNIIHIGLLMMLAAAVAGCSKDGGQHDEPGELVEMNLSLPGLTPRNTKAITDKSVERVRIFAFNAYGGVVVNRLIDTPTDPFSFKIPMDTYDFYLIVNEPDDRPDANTGTPEYSVLNAVNSLANLQRVHIDKDHLVATDGLYVMSASQRNVVVKAQSKPEPDGTYKAVVDYTPEGGSPTSNSSLLEMTAYRLATKVNLKLVREDTPTTAIPNSEVADAKITGLPASVPLLKGIQSVEPFATEVALTPEENIESNPSGSTYAGHTAIIPSCHFVDASNANKAAKLVVQIKDESQPRQIVIGHELATSVDDANADYTLHRNTIYHITGKLGYVLDINVSVGAWDEHDLPQKVGFKWLGGDELYLSSRSPIGLRRAGLLEADDYTLKTVKVEIIDANPISGVARVTRELKDFAPMQDRNNPAYAGHVNHLSGVASDKDIVITQTGGIDASNAASIAENMQVKLRIHHLSFAGGYKEITVYMNRTKINNTVFMDRNLGAVTPQGTGGYWWGNELCPPKTNYQPAYRRPTQTEWMAALNTNTTITDIGTTFGDAYNATCVTEKRTGYKVVFVKGGAVAYDNNYWFNRGTVGYYIGNDYTHDELQIHQTFVRAEYHTNLTIYGMLYRCIIPPPAKP